MSSAAVANLPEEFLLHIQSSRKEPWSHYVLVRKTTGIDGKARLTLSPHTTILVPPAEPAHYKKGTITYVKDGMLASLPIVSTDNAVLVLASFKQCMSTTVQVHTATTPKMIPILYTSKYRTLLGKGLRANFIAAPAVPPSPVVTATPITIPSPSAMPPSPVPPPLSAPADTIGHVDPPAAPTKKPKKVSKPAVAATVTTPTPKGHLAPFVAKQLLALAKLRHEQCPIVAEEYSDGNTAVMPCGHLFAQIAIEESFKKTPNACPACRAYGRPTYV
jgi:hypothetical protein